MNQSRSVQDSVYTALRSSIINLNLAPGTTISEKEISLRFEVSRTPVREAFIHLSKEGLVRVIPQKETQVSLIDFRRVEQEFFLRKSLEMAVLELFLRESGPEDFEEMEKALEQQTGALDRNALIDFVKYDYYFHRVLFEAGGQLLSWDLMQNMNGHYHRVRLLVIRLKGVARDVIAQHQTLLAALRQGDLARARGLLDRHIHTLDIEEKMLREEFPGYFASAEVKNLYEVDFGGLPLLF